MDSRADILDLDDRFDPKDPAPVMSYTLTIPQSLMYSINGVAKSLDTPKHELVQKLLTIGLQHYLDFEKNPANRPKASVEGVLATLYQKINKLQNRIASVEEAGGHVARPADVLDTESNIHDDEDY